MAPPQERLDSWKAIAEYLGRDVATVRRWEKLAGLPVHRVAGSPGRSVFAYRAEIDDWLRRKDGSDGATEASAPETDPPEHVIPSAIPPAVPPPASSRRWSWKVALATVVAGLAAIGSHGRGPSADSRAMSVEVTDTGIIARRADRTELWRHAFPATEKTRIIGWGDHRAILLGGANGSIIAGTSFSDGIADRSVQKGGRLLQFSPSGTVERSFVFDDRLAFGDTTYEPPWVITDYLAIEQDGARRLAVAAHHIMWWPSVVAVLTDRLERATTFVNAGWVEHLQWLSPDRLLVMGYSNERNAGMAALLDPATMNGQSPADDPTYVCRSCGPESPLRYVTMPRSELNHATASRFNRAYLQSSGTRVVIHTVEVPREADPGVAIYEFTYDLEPIRASYGDRYWELHRALEAEGKLHHPRERCPERNGPTHVDVWQPGAGWKTVRFRK